MFGFLSRNKQEEVRKIFQNRMNRSFLRQFRYGKRLEPRGAFCEVVWVITSPALKRIESKAASLNLTEVEEGSLLLEVVARPSTGSGRETPFCSSEISGSSGRLEGSEETQVSIRSNRW